MNQYSHENQENAKKAKASPVGLRTDGPMDGPMDRRMVKASYRDARTHLKTDENEVSWDGKDSVKISR